MKLRAPEYYKKFQCIADKCKHNCCMAGWEIDIDENTADYYKNVPGEFGKKLQKNIDFSENKHFILDSNNKCPFLNNKNLCDIYLTLGPHSLCQICTDHPRYYEWFKDIKECGVGLCCEEAARIILSYDKNFSTYEINIPDEEVDGYNEVLYSYLNNVRLKIIKYLDDEHISLSDRIRNVLWYSYTIQQNIDNNLLDDEEILNIDVKIKEKNYLKEILGFYLELEPNDINWIFYLKNNIKFNKVFLEENNYFISKNPEIHKYLKNISIYFIWRYFLKGTFDYDVLSKVKLMALSVLTINYLFFCEWKNNNIFNFENAVDITRRYSEEIEYSDENLKTLADSSYELKIFSTENLMNLFF